ITLGCMLYVAPTRRLAALAIWAASCAVAGLLLLASYGFHLSTLWQSVKRATFLGITWHAFAIAGAYRALMADVAQSGVAVLVSLSVTVPVYLVWRRARYFGNTAPLLMAVLFLLLSVATPHYPGSGFRLMAVPFLFLFISGIAADLLETPNRSAVLGC